MKSILSCKASCESDPKEIKKEFALSKETYKKEDFILTSRNSGMKAPRDFYRVYCNFCEEVLPGVLSKFKVQLVEVCTVIDKKYKNSPDSTYAKIASSLFWSFSHDSINNFDMDLFGIFIKGNDPDTMKPVNAPKRL